MAALKGVWGKIARVDLSTGNVTVVEPPEEVYRKYLGGEALGLYYLFKEGIVDPSVDPLGPQNMIQLLVGPTNGVGANARSVIVTKSAYNFLCVTTSGGRGAAELKFAGWDGIQIVGKAPKPVYIAIIDDKIEIRDASHVWGKGTEEAEMILQKEVLSPLEQRESILRSADMPEKWAALHPAAKKGIGAKRLAAVWLIGPGGEKQVWYASVMTEGARAHGRYGAGAIFGSKNLKGIVVRGTKGQPLADKARFLELTRAIQSSEKGDYGWRSYGTARIGYAHSNASSDFPIRNWQWEAWADPHTVMALSGPFMDVASFVRKQSCPGCAMHCLYPVETTSADPLMDRTISDMPDWEAMGMVGGNLGYLEMPGATPDDPFTGTHFDRAEALAKTQYTTFIHDNYGIDFIEGGALLALLMELRQRDLITPADLDGIDLQWGDVHAVDAIVKKIVARQGIGDVLARGTYETAKYFAEKKGKPEIMDYSMTCHRYAQPAHGVRANACGNAMSYLVAIRPTEHTSGSRIPFNRGDVDAAIAAENVQAFNNSLVICSFAAGHWTGKTVDLVKAATGWEDFQEAEIGKVGERAYALGRLFNLYCQGIKDPKKEWDCPEMVPAKRWFSEPLPAGPHKGKMAYDGDMDKVFNQLLPEYWKKRGWTEDKGIPTAEKLKELGIDDVAEAIAAQLR